MTEIYSQLNLKLVYPVGLAQYLWVLQTKHNTAFIIKQ